jgi:hypothetical protein
MKNNYHKFFFYIKLKCTFFLVIIYIFRKKCSTFNVLTFSSEYTFINWRPLNGHCSKGQNIFYYFSIATRLIFISKISYRERKERRSLVVTDAEIKASMPKTRSQMRGSMVETGSMSQRSSDFHYFEQKDLRNLSSRQTDWFQYYLQYQSRWI